MNPVASCQGGGRNRLNLIGIKVSPNRLCDCRSFRRTLQKNIRESDSRKDPDFSYLLKPLEYLSPFVFISPVHSRKNHTGQELSQVPSGTQHLIRT